MNIVASVALALSLLLAGCGAGSQSGRAASVAVPVIPVPASVFGVPGTFTVGSGLHLTFGQDPEVERIAGYFIDLLARSSGIRLQPLRQSEIPADQPVIHLQLQAVEGVAGEEGYTLEISPRRIVVSASSPRGLFYGVVTLWQLLTAQPVSAGKIVLPGVEIRDAPRFAWRGLMLDVSRHYMPPEFVKQMIDWMALHKLNTFHWHLTDDQGWRLEIKKYPRLTEVGAWRIPAGAEGVDAVTGKPRRYGGFYTQEQVRDIVSYAAARFVTIVPEIEMPGHAQAAIASYPALGTGGEPPIVSPDWGIHTYLFNVEEETFSFLEDVLTEVMALFPGQYIHIGGDEAVRDRWQSSARVQERMRTLGVPNETALQSYFVQRIERFLSAHGRKLVGWDEILEGGLPPAATVMSWRGIDGGVAAARQGHDVVMAPAPDLYFDHFQSDSPGEPPGRPNPITLADVYAFNPVPPALNAAEARHILGAQANLWTEHMRTTARVEQATFPRIAALAEVTWSAPEQRDWQHFLARLIPQLDRYRALGIGYADSAFEVRFNSSFDHASNALRVELSNQTGLGAIRYTMDGSDPLSTSTRYQRPLEFALPAKLRAAAFVDERRLSASRDRSFDQLSVLKKTDDELQLCQEKLALRLEDDAPPDAERAIFRVDILDPCWIYQQAPLDEVDRIAVSVGQLPYNFQLWKDASGIVTRASATPSGELQVRMDGCMGELLTTLSLAPAVSRPAVTTLEASFAPHKGIHDLCFVFASRAHDPLWAIDWVQLRPTGERTSSP